MTSEFDGLFPRKISHSCRKMEIDFDGMATSLSPWMQIQHGSLARETLIPKKKGANWRKFLKMNKSIVLVMLMLLLMATMPLLWHAKMSPEKPEENESEKRLSRMVRSLNSVQVAEEREESEKHTESSHIVLQNFPWVKQNNTLPNYFVGGGTQPSGGSDLYKSGAIVFLHHHRAGGVAISDCLTSVAQRHMYAKAPPWTSDSRLEWQNKVADSFSFQDEGVKVHMGQYSFGMCNNYKGQPCSYFTMLRDPMEREVSSYHYCKKPENSGDEMCKVLDANEVTLRDWVLHHGSLMFQQMLFSAHWCPSAAVVNQTLGGTAVGLSDPAGWPCWFRNRLWFESLTAAQRKHLLDYVLQNLDKWFSVIGLVEEFSNSIEMFQRVYNLPFNKCSSVKQFVPDDNGVGNNIANRKKNKDGYYDDNDPNYLKYDYFVQKTLDADYQIYKKAKQLFNVQKQMVFNKVH